MDHTNTTPIDIAIADDHILVIDGLKRALETIDDIRITGTYTRGYALWNDLEFNQPDVLLLDVQLPDIPGKEVARKVLKHYPDIRILVLSGVDSHFYIQTMIKMGCMGYILKGSADRDLLSKAIHSVYQDKLFIDPSIKEDLLQEILVTKRKSHNIDSKITIREKEVLGLILQELDNHEIADRLCISARTVENHRYNLLHKLNAKNTVGLVKAALEMGLKT